VQVNKGGLISVVVVSRFEKQWIPSYMSLPVLDFVGFSQGFHRTLTMGDADESAKADLVYAVTRCADLAVDLESSSNAPVVERC
jgi:hypothetical protein